LSEAKNKVKSMFAGRKLTIISCVKIGG
jgi:hypothetical protein